ncbi:TldD/PmbA family protein [Maricaulis parjimensis]|uniref:TldD/PmbA family protein n=1 Tax=Maricaulis parjimensis TaxID=144023 RepID=UPI001939D481|nr:metallopeptidase TldD-related protein [Maricaulis parjimensis]
MTQAQSAPDSARLQEIAGDLIQRAIKAGADAAEASVGESRQTELSVRDGQLEDIERSESLDAGVRVFVGQRQAGVAFSDLSDQGRQFTIERAVAMAKAAPEDPYSALAEPERLCQDPPALNLFEAVEWSPEELESRAVAVEKAARAIEGVTMTDTAFAGYGQGAAAYATSTGFNAGWRKSQFSYGASVIAEKNGAMERDYAATSARRVSDLKSIEEIGTEAGERTARRVGPQKIASGTMPVLFDRRVSTAFLSALCSAISGPAVARGVSFLREKMGEKIFADGITILDDPHRGWGHASCPFDGEGTVNQAREIISDGHLTTWFLNSAAARQLKLDPTGHARRNMGGPPGAGPTNLHLAAGSASRDDLIAGIGEGLLVSEMFGPSLNANTGDWSVGVSGYRITGGQIDHPVSEITVAGNLLDIFAKLVPASDLEFRGAVNAPSVCVDAISVGGL